HHHAHHRYPEHVHLRRAHDRLVRPEHRHRLARPSHPAQEARGEKLLTTEDAENSREIMNRTATTKICPSFPCVSSPCVPACPLWLKICVQLLVAMAVAPPAACTKGTDAATPAKSESPATTPVPPEATAPDNAPLPHIDSKRAFQYTAEVTAFGPRYMGNENHRKLEHYILDHLKGDRVEDDAFTADTVEGKFPVRNIIAKFPGTKDGIIVILGHYDTVYPLRNSGFVGANDGGSSTAILLEYANQLRGKKRDGYSVWLVWTDGEEAVRQWTNTDSVYGARHLAEKWEKDGTLKKIK